MEEEAKLLRQINQLTNERLLLPSRLDRKLPVEPLDVVVLLQMHFESKPFYGSIKNLLSQPTHNRFHPNPWDSDEIDKPSKKGPARISTSRVIKNVIKRLRLASHPLLADEFERTHIGFAQPVRHAIAHGTFLLPSNPGDPWKFSEYVKETPPFVSLLVTEYAHDEFTDFFKSFMNLRLSYLAAFKSNEEEWGPRNFNFVSKNQNTPHEKLMCTFNQGKITIKYQGNPIW